MSMKSVLILILPRAGAKYHKKWKALFHGLMIDWSAPEDSVSHGLCKQRWGDCQRWVKREKVPMETALKRPTTLLDMSYDKFFISIRWHRHTPFSKYYFIISDSFKMKSSSTWVIHASLCEGPILYFYVESVNLFLYFFNNHLSCCDPTIYMLIYSIMSFILPCLVQKFLSQRI